MKSPILANKDHRQYLLEHAEMKHWYELASGFKIGLYYGGEFRMGADAGQCLINNPSGEEWINLRLSILFSILECWRTSAGELEQSSECFC